MYSQIYETKYKSRIMNDKEDQKYSYDLSRSKGLIN